MLDTYLGRRLFFNQGKGFIEKKEINKEVIEGDHQEPYVSAAQDVELVEGDPKVDRRFSIN